MEPDFSCPKRAHSLFACSTGEKATHLLRSNSSSLYPNIRQSEGLAKTSWPFRVSMATPMAVAEKASYHHLVSRLVFRVSMVHSWNKSLSSRQSGEKRWTAHLLMRVMTYQGSMDRDTVKIDRLPDPLVNE